MFKPVLEVSGLDKAIESQKEIKLVISFIESDKSGMTHLIFEYTWEK